MISEKSKKEIIKNLEIKFKEAKIKIFNNTGYDINQMELPTIDFNLKGVVAGKAYGQKNLIKLNYELINKKEYYKEMITTTLYHELAHLIVSYLYRTNQYIDFFKGKYKTKPHGAEWKYIMEYILQTDSKRTHSFKVNKRKINKIEYICNCSSHFITNRIHQKISNGSIYKCKNCKEPIKIKENAKFLKR